MLYKHTWKLCQRLLFIFLFRVPPVHNPDVKRYSSTCGDICRRQFQEHGLNARMISTPLVHLSIYPMLINALYRSKNDDQSLLSQQLESNRKEASLLAAEPVDIVIQS